MNSEPFSAGPQDGFSGKQKIDKAALLAQCSLFSPLSQWELKSISQLMRLVEYKKDDTVYKEGADSEAFYVVVSGRFEAFNVSSEKRKVLAYLRRGDYFGEMSLLNNQLHSATVRALSDSITLELKKEDFKRIVETNAAISLEIGRRLSWRLKGGDTRTRHLVRSDVISIYSDQRRIGRTAFSINLAASLSQETRQKTILLDMSPTGSEIASRLRAKKVPIGRFRDIESSAQDMLSEHLFSHPSGFDVLSVGHEEGGSEQIVIPLLNQLAVDYRFILIDLPAQLDAMVHKALTQSDAIYFVTDSHLNNLTETKDMVAEIEKNLSVPSDKISIVINEVFFGVRTTSKVRKELFGHKACYSLSATPALKDKEETRLNPFVVDEPDAEYSRVVRHIARHASNNLVGLVLGSGAALGLAHIGVLKILERERIPIDLVAGSSIGALIGSLYAIGKTAAEIEAAALEIRNKASFIKLLDVNLMPVRGLLHGQGVMGHFKRHLGEKTFDDCRIPLKILGANLTTRQTVVFESGFVSDAVKTSIAIPAIFRPTIMGKDIVVDGGILSPLPVRALHRAGANKIIAVNVFPTTKDALERRILKEEIAEAEEKRMRNAGVLMRFFYRAGQYLRRRLYPNIFDILMNTIQTMESEISEMEGETADVLLRPVIPDASWVEFYKPVHFIRRGEEEALKMLPKIKNLVSQQNV